MDDVIPHPSSTPLILLALSVNRVYNISSMNQREYDRLKQKIQAEAEQKLRALDIVWAMLNETEGEQEQNSFISGAFAQSTAIPSSTDLHRQKDKPNGRPKRIRVTQEVKKAISEAAEEFDQQDISNIIESANPGVEVHRGSVSNAISRLLERRERINGMRIELAEHGSGSVPNVYRKVKDEVPQAESSHEEGIAHEEKIDEDDPFKDNDAGDDRVIDF